MALVVPDSKADFASTAFDMQMFVDTRGRERTLDEWHRLFAPSGWLLEEVGGLQTVGKMLVLKSMGRLDSLEKKARCIAYQRARVLQSLQLIHTA